MLGEKNHLTYLNYIHTKKCVHVFELLSEWLDRDRCSRRARILCHGLNFGFQPLYFHPILFGKKLTASVPAQIDKCMLCVDFCEFRKSDEARATFEPFRGRTSYSLLFAYTYRIYIV